ncbi:unnamed protein product [Orchesella dallaii]|uniref:Ionotropic glutamate receptor C-terminal domain-containing protein n=1 Tax=Orchesella dallaii TaxID=48710 RepID=A0ABP1QU53_9HEXA
MERAWMPLLHLLSVLSLWNSTETVRVSGGAIFMKQENQYSIAEFPQQFMHFSNQSYNYTCQRSWLSIEEATSVINNLTKLVNIRKIPARSFRSLYQSCRGDGHNCPMIYRSPFYLRWTFPSFLTCYSKPSNELVLRLYISFEAIYSQRVDKYYQPISETISILGEKESEDAKKFVKGLSPSLADNTVIQKAETRTMKDFHNVQPSYVAVAKMLLELTRWCNLTLVPTKDNKNPLNNELLIPGIYPRAYSTSVKKSQLGRGIYYERPFYYRVPALDLNFVYCDIPQTENFDPWDFSSMLEPFQSFVWFSIIIAILGVTFVLLLQLNIYSFIYLDTNQNITVCSIAFSLISSIISTPVYFGLRFWLRRSFLFVSWLFACLILSNFYTGIVTSLLIQPMPIKSLEDLKDLIVNNYSLVFSEGTPIIYDSTVDLVEIHKQTNLQKQRSNTSHKLKHKHTSIEKLTILMANPKSQYLPEKDFLERVAYDPKSAAFGAWLYTFQVYHSAISRIEKESSESNIENSKAPKKVNRGCFFGKKMFPGLPNLWVFYPPNAEWLYGTFLGFVQNGIDRLWVREFYGLNYAKRVQDREKVSSPTEIAPDPNSLAPKPIQLRGSHFLTVIMAGVLGVVGSICCFLLECLEWVRIAWKWRKRMENIVTVIVLVKESNEVVIQFVP